LIGIFEYNRDIGTGVVIAGVRNCAWIVDYLLHSVSESEELVRIKQDHHFPAEMEEGRGEEDGGAEIH